MTLKSMQWALYEAPVSDPRQRIILVAMGDFARADGRNCWLSQRSLAQTADCSVRTVREHLKAMVAAGVIRRGNQSVIPDEVPLNRRPVVYDLCLDRVKELPQADQDSDEPDTYGTDGPRPNGVDNPSEAVDNPPSAWAAESAGQRNRVGQGGNLASSGRKPASPNSLGLREVPRAGADSLPSLPPPIGALRAAEAAACAHGAPPGRCALCRAPSSAPPEARPAARSHHDEIRAALTIHRRTRADH